MTRTVHLASALAALLLSAAPVAAQQEPPAAAEGDAAAQPAAGQEPPVVVREADGVYTVTARFSVPQPRDVALAVLTDYEEIPRFMPHVTSSVVRGRFEGGAIVEQEAVSRLMMFSRRVHLLLEVEEADDALRFRDASGRSFARYAGAWQFVEHEGGTTITYELLAEPSFDVPEFLLVRLLRRDAARMIQRLRAEMAAPRHQPARP